MSGSSVRKARLTPVVALLAAGLLAAFSLPASAAKGGGGGGGGGAGGGGGGGGSGAIYSDLVIAYRDVLGLPILAQYGADYCVQPVSYAPIPGLSTVVNPVDGQPVTLVPLMGELAAPAAEEEEVEACDPQPAYAGYVTEVELERLNQGRSPSKVVERQLAEVKAMITDAELTLEPSGRLMADGVTIDSPLMNTGIYLSLMRSGVLLDLNGAAADLPDPASYQSGPFAALHHAAVALAMAAGKEVPINVDTFAYHNRVLAIPATSVYPHVRGMRECVLGDATVDEERYPRCGVEGEWYIDYTGFSYDRADTFTGCATYHPGAMEPAVTEPIVDIVFGGEAAAGAGIKGVAQHSDDARLVNLWFHDHELLILEGDSPGENTCSTQNAG